jgi:hypothetical protein
MLVIDRFGRQKTIKDNSVLSLSYVSGTPILSFQSGSVYFSSGTDPVPLSGLLANVSSALVLEESRNVYFSFTSGSKSGKVYSLMDLICSNCGGPRNTLYPGFFRTPSGFNASLDSIPGAKTGFASTFTCVVPWGERVYISLGFSDDYPRAYVPQPSMANRHDSYSQILVYDYRQDSWSSLSIPASDLAPDEFYLGIWAMEVYRDELYCSVRCTNSSKSKLVVFSPDTNEVSRIYTHSDIGLSSYDLYFRSMRVYKDKLYMATHNGVEALDNTSSKIVVFDGTSFSFVSKSVAGVGNPSAIFNRLDVVNNYLMATTNISTTGSFPITCYDGSSWISFSGSNIGLYNVYTRGLYLAGSHWTVQVSPDPLPSWLNSVYSSGAPFVFWDGYPGNVGSGFAAYIDWNISGILIFAVPLYRNASISPNPTRDISIQIPQPYASGATYSWFLVSSRNGTIYTHSSASSKLVFSSCFGGCVTFGNVWLLFHSSIASCVPNLGSKINVRSRIDSLIRQSNYAGYSE